VKVVSVIAPVAACFLLSGCASTLAQHAGAAHFGAAGSASSTNLTAQQVLTAYTQTFATDPSVTVQQLLASPGGLQGIGSGPTLPTADQSNSSFKTVEVSFDSATAPTKMTLQVEGQTINLAVVSHLTGTTMIGGYNYNSYYFSPDGADLSPSTTKDWGRVITGKYSTVGAFLKNARGLGTSFPNDGFLVFTTGAVTPTANMPTQILSYNGYWAMLAGTQYDEGSFTATVDFNNKTFNYQVGGGSGGGGASGTAAITGNQFTGTVAISTPTVNGNGTLAGEFYGPNAEEIGGVISGSGTVNGVANQPLVGAFAGNR